MPRRRPEPKLPEQDAAPDRSRSQKKRESTALQRLGEALSRQPLSVLKHMDLPADIFESIAGLRTMHSREARRRQLQYIGRLMREADWRHIADQLDALSSPQRAQGAPFSPP